MRIRCLFVTSLLACTAAAQTGGAVQLPAPAGPDPDSQRVEPADGRKNQKIERIRIEDAGVRIDEVRYGGQTQSITVQPKADVPEYEIQPTDLARSRPADHRDGLSNATGQRVWNLFKF